MSEPSSMEEGRSNVSPAEPAQDLKGSYIPRPEVPPPPTCWPFVTAVGLMVFFWGFVLNLLVASVGVALFAIGMGGLIGDWVREHRSQAN